jgi:hypothetical protein
MTMGTTSMTRKPDDGSEFLILIPFYFLASYLYSAQLIDPHSEIHHIDICIIVTVPLLV